MGELSLGRTKVATYYNRSLGPHFFYKYFGTLITGRLMEVRLYLTDTFKWEHGR